jgi:hypothetical protein
VNLGSFRIQFTLGLLNLSEFLTLFDYINVEFLFGFQSVVAEIEDNFRVFARLNSDFPFGDSFARF